MIFSIDYKTSIEMFLLNDTGHINLVIKSLVLASQEGSVFTNVRSLFFISMATNLVLYLSEKIVIVFQTAKHQIF